MNCSQNAAYKIQNESEKKFGKFRAKKSLRAHGIKSINRNRSGKTKHPYFHVYANMYANTDSFSGRM